jgi:acyl dehydratase
MGCKCTKQGMPPVATMAMNVAGAVGRAIKAVANGETVKVSAEVAEKRIEACKACPRVKVIHMHGQNWLRCTVCGCWLDAVSFAKAHLATETCPEKRWP